MERLSKFIASSGYCSRRKAEVLILQGRVFVNQEKILNLSHKVSEKDDVSLDNSLVLKKPAREIWLFYKPKGIIHTDNDPYNRKTTKDILPDNLPNHVISVGRLDLMSEGLLLLTNDGLLSRNLELPINEVKRGYKVKIFGELNQEAITELKQGITISGIRYKSIDVNIIKTSPSNQWLNFTLIEGKNREIRKVLEHYGYKVNRLIRISFGLFKINDLKPGEIIKVSKQEVIKLLSSMKSMN